MKRFQEWNEILTFHSTQPRNCSHLFFWQEKIFLSPSKITVSQCESCGFLFCHLIISLCFFRYTLLSDINSSLFCHRKFRRREKKNVLKRKIWISEPCLERRQRGRCRAARICVSASQCDEIASFVRFVQNAIARTHVRSDIFFFLLLTKLTNCVIDVCVHEFAVDTDMVGIAKCVVRSFTGSVCLSQLLLTVACRWLCRCCCYCCYCRCLCACVCPIHSFLFVHSQIHR